MAPAKTGKVAQHLSDARSEAEISKLVDQITKKLANRSTVPACHDYLMAVLSADRPMLIKIIANFTLISKDDDPLVPIFNHLNATISPRIAEPVTEFGIGNGVSRIDRLLRNEQLPIIAAKEFRTNLHAFINKHDASNLLLSLSETPADGVVQETIRQGSSFVRQLALVDADINLVSNAVSDFLKSSADRTDWADQGLIVESSIDEYNKEMFRRFTSESEAIKLLAATPDQSALGRAIYNKCCSPTPIPLQGRVVPNHFLSGTMNDMANRLEIGWHPDYKKIMGEEE